MAAAAVAAAASKGPIGVIPPASPFSELLRRSRFASYDPKIKQTYSSPPAYAHRGNWGLKRPIAQRRRNAYITVKSYEDHAQYIEWNNAENQVRFIKQIEELNITPGLVSGTEWVKTLGAVATNYWLTDSEFDTAKDVEFKFVENVPEAAESAEVDEAAVEEAVSPPTDDISSLGKSGKGNYGVKAAQTARENAALLSKSKPQWLHMQPNVEAMSPREFEHHLKKLRSMRPAFLAEVRQQIAKRKAKGQLKQSSLNPESSSFTIACQNHMSRDHVSFLDYQTDLEFFQRDLTPSTSPSPSDSPREQLPRELVNPKIKPQPHRVGGLMYSHPTRLDTFFTTTPHPAFIIAPKFTGNKFTRDKREEYAQASYAGIIAQVKNNEAFKPLFDSKTRAPVNPAAFNQSVLNVRVHELKLEEPPRVVGPNGQGLKGVLMQETVVEDVPLEERGTDNPHKPGSFEYVRIGPLAPKQVLMGSSGRSYDMPLIMRKRRTVNLGPPSSFNFGIRRPDGAEVVSSLRRMAGNKEDGGDGGDAAGPQGL